ncbi:MAG: SOS response-associated peptidase [Marinobacter sp.]|nr:SOS response-associated peptidase [Marinobacter sp.]
MCGRFALHTPASLIAKRYWSINKPVGDLISRYNITPGSQILTVRPHEEIEPVFSLATWGFRPGWAKQGAPTPINARIESLNKPYFNDAFKHARCVIPASGWYEWRTAPDGTKEPYYITRPDQERGEALLFAGLYAYTGQGTDTCAAIITEPASALHDRQPVLLDPQSLSAWLDPGITATETLRGNIARTDPTLLHHWRVSTAVNRATTENTPALIEPLAGFEAPGT